MTTKAEVPSIEHGEEHNDTEQLTREIESSIRGEEQVAG